MYNDAATLISTLGFPIVACIFLSVFCYKMVMMMTDIIRQNTEVITEMKTIIEEHFHTKFNEGE